MRQERVVANTLVFVIAVPGLEPVELETVVGVAAAAVGP